MSARERVLVTGAAGFIGSHLVERLVNRGDCVTGVDNFDPFYSRQQKLHNLSTVSDCSDFNFVEADCVELEPLEASLADQQFDVIVHLAAKGGVRPSIQDPLGYVRANVAGTQAMLEFARRRDIKRFVFASSSSVYGNNAKVPFAEDDLVENPISPYAATKRAGELLCATYHSLFGIAIIALRYFTVYGPRQRPDLAIRKFATLMLQNEPIPMFGDGTTERDYTWVDDVMAGTLAAIDRTRTNPGEFEIINLGESRTTSLERLIELLSNALDIEPRIARQPTQPGDVARTYADVTKAKSLLGYAPSMPIEEGIRRFVDWLRSVNAPPTS